MLKSLIRLVVPLGIALLPSLGHSQVVGSGTSTNSFPFGGPASGSGTAYQQVYAASNFAAPGLLQSVSFFRSDPGDLRTATFDLFVSTTPVAVDALSTTNFDANRGADNALFGTFAVSGAAPATLTFAGAPFSYNPLAGNLLLDFRFTSAGPKPSDRPFFAADNGNAGGVYSRSHNFGTSGFVGYGLQTGFVFAPLPVLPDPSSPVTTVPEPTSLVLLAAGVAALAGFRRRVIRRA